MVFFNLFPIIVIAVTAFAEIPMEERLVPEVVENANDQFHTQDSFGQYKYVYVNGDSSKEESRSLDGTTRGSYSYKDADGVLQKVVYQADALGFRVLGTNIPSAPLASDSAEEITPAFSNKLLSPAERRYGIDSVVDTANIKNNQNEITINSDEEKKIADNDDDKQTSTSQSTQQPDVQTDKNIGGYQYLFPLASNNEVSHLNTEYLMPFVSTNFNYFVPNSISAHHRLSFLPIFQPDYVPPFARSQYRSPYTFFKGFIPLFSTRGSNVARVLQKD